MPVSVSPPGPDRLLAARVLREEAAREGFARTRFARAQAAPKFERFESWIASGLHAGMRYLARTREARSDPERILPGARSVVCLSAAYPAEPYRAGDGAELARYARGPDYHGALRKKAEAVVGRVAERLSTGFRHRVCVDSTPIAERSFAAAAGLGWIGKNGCLIDPDRGSYL